MREIYATNNALSAALHRRSSKIPKQKWEITAATDFFDLFIDNGEDKKRKTRKTNTVMAQLTVIFIGL